MSVPWFGLAVAAVVLIFGFYWFRTQLPDSITIAGGPEGGRYAALSSAVGKELERRLGIPVTVLKTQGSLANIQKLQSGTADFALYQPETLQLLADENIQASAIGMIEFVCNLYPEYLIPIAPADSPQLTLDSPNRQLWSCNDELSGDYAMATLLKRHLGADDTQIDVTSIPYNRLPDQLRKKGIGVGILCCGLQAPILKRIFQEGDGHLVQIPAVKALAARNPSLQQAVIPAGMFHISPQVPAADFETVALQAQLLTGQQTSVRVVEEITRILTDAGFQRRNGLSELFNGGRSYATAAPEFPMHSGASHVFFPDLKPLVNPDFVEGTEGLRSFVVSLAVSVWLLHRWWVRRRDLQNEHQLDRYIRDVLALEHQQMEIDGEGGPEEGRQLQDMLDKVTLLRKEALAEFTAHQLNEDRATECFINLCHALSDKINGKLTRHTLRQCLRRERQE